MVERHEGRFVEIRRVPTAFEAELLVGRLVDAGIDARVDGRSPLQDQWAAVQRMMRSGLIRVFVPEVDRARAEEILATPVPSMDDPEGEDLRPDAESQDAGEGGDDEPPPSVG